MNYVNIVYCINTMGVVGQTVLARSLGSIYCLQPTVCEVNWGEKKKNRKESILSPTVTVCEEEKLSFTKDNFLPPLCSWFPDLFAWTRSKVVFLCRLSEAAAHSQTSNLSPEIDIIKYISLYYMIIHEWIEEASLIFSFPSLQFYRNLYFSRKITFLLLFNITTQSSSTDQILERCERFDKHHICHVCPVSTNSMSYFYTWAVLDLNPAPSCGLFAPMLQKPNESSNKMKIFFQSFFVNL